MIYKANDKYGASLSSGYTVGQSTLYVSAAPDNVPTIIVAAKGTDNETVFSVTGKTVSSLTGVTRLRGANVNLDAQTPITCLNNEEFINQYETALFAAEGLKAMIAGTDGGSNDDYAISLDPAPTDYDNLIGVPILFKANTANTGAATLNLNGLGAKTIKKNLADDLASNDIKVGQIVLVSYDGTNFQFMSTLPTVDASILTTAKYARRGFMINGKIVVSVASNNLTVAIKGDNGEDPSATNIVYVKIGDTVRTITAPLSRTLAAGTSWMALGAAAFATIEQDLFVYLVWDSNSSAVGLTFSRYPNAFLISDFSSNTTLEKYCAGYSDFTSTDEVENIGRFAATLSGGAGYTWSIPTFTGKNLIQETIRYTRLLDYNPTFTMTNPPSSTTTVAKYKIDKDQVYVRFKISGTANGANAGQNITLLLPFTTAQNTNYTALPIHAVWTDGVSFTDEASLNNVDGVSTFSQFTSTTRKPTLISISADYDI